MTIDILSKELTCVDCKGNFVSSRFSKNLEYYFDVKEYWERRLSGCFSLEGVGCLGKGERYNWYLYELKKQVMNRALKKLHLSTKNKAIFDVGSGTGFWINYYLNKGTKYIYGCDISNTAVRNLKTKYGKYDNVFIFEADFGSKPNSFNRKFDIVNAIDVAYHIVDNDDFNTFIENISRCLHSRGYVFLTDTFPEEPQHVQYLHVKNRTLNEYNQRMKKNGIKIIMVSPMYCFLHPPTDEKPSSTLIKTVYKISQPLYKRKCLGQLYLSALYIVDSILTNFQNLGFSIKLLVGRKI